MKGFIRSSTRTFALSIGLFLVSVLHAREPVGQAGLAPPPPKPRGIKASSCSPASKATELAFNNVRAIIENGGNKWTLRQGQGQSGYEVPITRDFTGPKAIYAGGLWMGGLSPDNQLKIAAVLYRFSGRNDFWPGPLTTTGGAEVDFETCLQYDKFFQTTRAQAETHVQWKRCTEDPDCDFDALFPDGYSIPPAFLEYPAMGNFDAGQSLYLAPFFDWNGDGIYNPFDGDYPDYGFETSVEDCKNKDRETPLPLFGDFNIYWIFNDKGDIHTETSGLPIGLEVRAQAFAFATNDEINNMTFYNYLVINQGTQTLLNTYFGHFVDPDVGCSNDDFVGCDVQRGLGFCYNWDDVDESGCFGAPGYGGPSPPPPAIGVDFFEGPYQDADDIDNPGPDQGLSCQEYQQLGGIPYRGIGIGYGDGVADNERFGMRAFLYFNREGPQQVIDPRSSVPADWYNYLRSIWKDNTPMSHGGTGYSTDPNAVRTFYMFPWDTDPVGWGTNCVPQGDWREIEPTPTIPDRRFVQSAGPFTLEPGAYNNVTVGVVYARATQGGATASVGLLKIADDKAQALFDNCFKILDGPDAPDITIRELDRELILYLTNPPGSNNENQAYQELDPVIPETDPNGNPYDRFYRFEGYKVYQLRNATVSVSDLDNPELAKLIYQADLRNGIGQIINYDFDPDLNLSVPREMVRGADTGIVNAIRVTRDAFALGEPTLVNFKSYYFMAIAYAYNNYQTFTITTNPITGIQEGSGQAKPFVAGRKAAFGAIRSYVGIPHKPAPENGGTIANSSFGQTLPITRLEGQGNGALPLELQPGAENAALVGSPWRAEELRYRNGRGPIRVRIVDPLEVPDARFEVWMLDTIPGSTNLNKAFYKVVNLDSATTGGRGTIFSDRAIDINYEQLLLNWGISVTLGQTFYTGTGGDRFTEPTSQGSIRFSDPSKAWFTGIPDVDGPVPQNWIRSGTQSFTDAQEYNDRINKDNDQLYERILGGTWAPWALVGQAAFQPSNTQQVSLSQVSASPISETPSVLVVMTPDKSKWTRSPVLENESNTQLTQGGAGKLQLRASPSIDKDGRKAGTPGANNDEATRGGTQPTGMGWFPGYAIDLETGERLNIAYSENSFWGGEIGRDMIFNPSSELYTPSGEPVFGGCHWIYVFKNDRRQAFELNQPNPGQRVPGYDEGEFIRSTIQTTQLEPLRRVFRAVGWVGSAMVVPGRQLLETEVRLSLGVAKPYRTYLDYTGSPEPYVPARNGGRPLYAFSTSGFAVQTGVAEVLNEVLDIINVVPNPYYAFSGYETSRLDNRVKFINLPQRCTISIYNVSGTLVRKFRKDNDLTFLDWDLKNQANVPIAGGVYICHVDVPDVGEKVLKWFGVMRPLDIQNF
jgi:hypothetical protein